MAIEHRQCQSCKSSFTVEAEDFKFYAKVNVPPPTFCPNCRMQRRMAYRNERTLYQRDCDLCHNSMISAYPRRTAFPVYCANCWWSDKWNPLDYGQTYDATKPFLAQWRELQSRVPRPYTNNQSPTTMVNSAYTNCASELKNCYLTYGCMRDEDCAYSHYINDSRQCYDTLYCLKSENCYDCLDIENCYNVYYSQSCAGCLDSFFLFDCRNCSDCLGCVGLRTKQYYILNQPYSKADYEKEKAKLALHTRSGRVAFQERYQAIYYRSPRKYYHGQNNEGFSGDYISHCENTYQSFYIKQARSCKFVFWCNTAEDVYDYMSWGTMEFSYECVSNGYNSYHCLFTDASWSDNKDLEYCSLCITSSNLFGCIGLTSQRNCILNKVYSETDYYKLREQIVHDMTTNLYQDKRGIAYPYGEFPPIELSPFLYADTVAQEHFPLTATVTQQLGYPWAESEKNSYTIQRSAVDLPNDISAVGDDIIGQVIGCLHAGKCLEQCTEAFRITMPELQFYRRLNIPLAQLCYNCRHAGRVALRNPLQLWSRRCQCAGHHSNNGTYTNVAQQHQPHILDQPCPNTFTTSYNPNKKEVVYCESCYNAEIV